MLRLKKARRQEISVTVRDKSPWMSRTFLFALTIALGIHLSAVLVFHIHSILASGEVVLPPTLVETDASGVLDDANVGVLAYMDFEGRSQRHISAPVASRPKIPDMKMPTIAREMEYLNDESNPLNPFLEIEEEWQYLKESRMPSKNPAIQIHVAGALADVPLLNEGKEGLSVTPMKNETIIFSVQLERKSGRIFWYIPKQMSSMKVINEAAEKILKNMVFQTDPLAFVAAGEVEIQFMTSESTI